MVVKGHLVNWGDIGNCGDKTYGVEIDKRQAPRMSRKEYIERNKRFRQKMLIAAKYERLKIEREK